MTKLKYLSELPKLDYLAFSQQLSDANREIGILKGACFGLPNPELLLSPSLLREALASSEIENIITTLADVLQAQLFTTPEQSSADKEVLRYNSALKAGIYSMNHKYLGSNTIKTVHDVLIPNEPNFRTTQNALRNTLTGEIVYLPIPANEIPGYLSDLEIFLNSAHQIDPILRTIIIHYQFESIHPFGDGNGRTGRILIVLCMIYFHLLDLPVLFISEYINTHKAEYYSVFQKVRQHGDYTSFILYMLQAITKQAKKSTRTLLKISKLHHELKIQIQQALPKIYSHDLVDAIFNQPLITPIRYAELMHVSYPTALKHLKSLEEKGFMSSTEIGKYRIFTNLKLMQLLGPKSSY